MLGPMNGLPESQRRHPCEMPWTKDDRVRATSQRRDGTPDIQSIANAQLLESFYCRQNFYRESDRPEQARKASVNEATCKAIATLSEFLILRHQCRRRLILDCQIGAERPTTAIRSEV